MKYVMLLVAVLASACSTSTVVGPSPTPAPVITPTPQPAPQPVIVLPTLLVGLRVTGYDLTNTHFVTAVFAAEVSEGPASYSFDYGDGSASFFPSASNTTAHQYPLTGTWVVRVTAQTKDGRRASASVTITTPPCQTYPSPGCR